MRRGCRILCAFGDHPNGKSLGAVARCDEIREKSLGPRRVFVRVVTWGVMNSRVTFDTHTDPELLLILAKAGYSRALVHLLDRCRHPLAEQARCQVGRRLRVKLDVEDLLQEVSLEACRDIGKFRGSTEGEFLCWLRKILETILLNQVRHYFGTGRRNLRHERRLAEMDDSTRGLVRHPVAPDTSPSQKAVKRERAGRLAEALETLPQAYREVIVLRHQKGLSFLEVARRMDRTEDSVKNMWVRALRQLRRLLGNLQ
jgi:RNA polymerase sigma-70 factor (ECF subfamily)